MSNSVVFSTLGNVALPKECYIDTNSIVELVFNRQYNQEVADFLTNASLNDTLIAYSDHFLAEVMDCVHYEVLKGEAQKAGFNGTVKGYENSGVNHGAIVLKKYNEVIETLEMYAGDILINLDNPPSVAVKEAVGKLLLHGVAPKDARHISIMHQYGINSIFTLDEGFTRAPNLNIYAPNSKLLKHVQKGSNYIPFQSEIPDPQVKIDT